jgi:hypothetical protein
MGAEDFDRAYSEGRSMTPEGLIGDLMPVVE